MSSKTFGDAIVEAEIFTNLAHCVDLVLGHGEQRPYSERHREEYQRYQHLWGALEQVAPRRPRRQQALQAGLLVLATAMLFALQRNVAVDMANDANRRAG